MFNLYIEIDKHRKEIIFLLMIFASLLFLFIDLKFQWICVLLTISNIFLNESIQALGIFLNSNKKNYSIKNCLIFSFTFVVFVFFTWLFCNHIIDYGKLDVIPYANDFNKIYLLIPITLITMTYYKIPISTTFLVLLIFGSNKTDELILIKTFCGYFLSFLTMFLITKFILKYEKFILKLDNNIIFYLQYISTLLLWIFWITQNIGNSFVYVPKKINIYELFLFIIVSLIFISYLFTNKSEELKTIVLNKKNIESPILNILINNCFIFIIIYLKKVNNIPIATNFIFIGLLAGREFSFINFSKRKELINTTKIVLKDFFSSVIGILISLFLMLLYRLCF